MQPPVRILLRALALFLLWLPVFLAVYPGFFAYDATDEFNEVLTGEYVTRHPLLHVLMLGKTVTAFYDLTGSFNIGIAVSYTHLDVYKRQYLSCAGFCRFLS